MAGRKANFFLIGAAKSGTTALCSYLRSHPGVFMTVPKEPHFFSTDFPDYGPIRRPEDYDALFDGVTENHHAIGEASNTYLMSREAARHVAAYNPRARILALLRNPVEMVHAAHNQYLHLREETEPDFERAWALTAERRTGRRIPGTNRDPKVLFYDEIARYHEQLIRWYACFPRSQIKVVVYDDFARDTRGEYLSILEFLGLEAITPETFPRINESRRHRSQLIGHVSTRPPPLAVRAAERAKAMLGIDRLGLLAKVRAWNDRVEPRKPISPALRQTIVDEYRSDVEALSALLERDLTALWLGG